MSLFCTYFFHDYGLTNECITKNCSIYHEKPFSRQESNLVKVLSCLPILGQIIGALEIRFGCEGLKSKCEAERICAISLTCRGILTFLGLGIICLLLDIIITCATFIKNRISGERKHNSEILDT